MPKPPPDIEPVLLQGDLTEEILAAYLEGPDLAVDTEALGLATLHDRLCLVQMCDRKGRATIVQIPSYLPTTPAESRAPRLKRLLEDPGVVKVFHFARFDVAALLHYLGTSVAPLYCTRTASKLVRTYTDRHGLKDNLLELLDVELDKTTRSSDWSAETLSREQIRYALSDVTLLLPLMDKLDQMLVRRGRRDLALECFQAIPTFAKLDLLGFELLLEH